MIETSRPQALEWAKRALEGGPFGPPVFWLTAPHATWAVGHHVFARLREQGSFRLKITHPLAFAREVGDLEAYGRAWRLCRLWAALAGQGLPEDWLWSWTESADGQLARLSHEAPPEEAAALLSQGGPGAVPVQRAAERAFAGTGPVYPGAQLFLAARSLAGENPQVVWDAPRPVWPSERALFDAVAPSARQVVEKSAAPGRVQVVVAENPKDEAVQLCEAVRALQEEGMALEDIRVVMPRSPGYRAWLGAALRSYGLHDPVGGPGDVAGGDLGRALQDWMHETASAQEGPRRPPVAWLHDAAAYVAGLDGPPEEGEALEDLFTSAFDALSDAEGAAGRRETFTLLEGLLRGGPPAQQPCRGTLQWQFLDQPQVLPAKAVLVVGATEVRPSVPGPVPDGALAFEAALKGAQSFFWVSWPKQDMEGGVQFPDVGVLALADRGRPLLARPWPEDRSGSPQVAAGRLVRALRRAGAQGTPADLPGGERGRIAFVFSSLSDERARQGSPAPASTAVSASALETYGACPAKYFFQYVLRLAPTDPGATERMNLGLAVHSVLRRASERPVAVEEMRRAFEAALDGERPADVSYLVEMVSQAQMDLAEHDARSAFQVQGLEVPFGRDGDRFPPLWLRAGQGKVRLVGRIDRLDAAPDADGRLWLKVIDYKRQIRHTQPLWVEEGITLQLPLYLLAVTGPQAPGAAMLYFAYGHTPATSRNGARPSPIRMAGFYRRRRELFTALDRKAADPEAPPVIQGVALTAKGQLRKNGGGLDDGPFEALLEAAVEAAEKALSGMVEGHFMPRPYYDMATRETPCASCAFKVACRFDPSAGHHFHVLGLAGQRP